MPACREDQILIAGRLGDSCCTSYFCSEWLRAPHQPFLIPTSVVTERKSWGICMRG